MEIKFDVYFKKNLGTLCKDNEVDLDGKEAYVNIDLSLVDRLEANYSVGATKYTDEVTIKDIEAKEILIPFKSDVVKKGLNEFEIVAYMKNGDIKVSQTYTYNIDEGIGEGRQTGSGGSSDGHTHSNLNILNSITQTKVNEWNNKADRNHTHSNYASATHSHSEYANYSHTHNASEIEGLENVDIDLSDYYTKSETYNKTEIDSKIANMGVGGSVDLSNYYTKSETDEAMNDKANKVHTHNEYLTELPTHEHEQYLTEHQDISHKADKTDIYTKLETDNKISEEIAKAQLGGSGEIDLSSYATKTYVDDEISKIELKEGPQGPQGVQGPKGDTGEVGPQGLKGEDGLTTSILVNGQTYTHIDGVITLPNYPNNAGGNIDTISLTDEQIKQMINSIDVPVSELSMNKQHLKLKEGEYEILSFSWMPSYVSQPTVIWESNNPSVAEVNQEGKVTAVAEGEALITITSSNGISTNCGVVVEAVAQEIVLQSISLNQTSLSLHPGDTSNLVATFNPTDATYTAVSWSTDNDQVATVSGGKVTCVGEGSCVITCTSNQYPSIKAECSVEVTELKTLTSVVNGLEHSYSFAGLATDDSTTIEDLTGTTPITMANFTNVAAAKTAYGIIPDQTSSRLNQNSMCTSNTTCTIVTKMKGASISYAGVWGTSGIKLCNNSDGQYYQFTDGGYLNRSLSTTSLSEQAWDVVAVSFDFGNSLITTYVNGVKRANTTMNAKIVWNNKLAIFDGYSTSNNVTNKLCINSLLIYNRCITDEEAVTIYKDLVGDSRFIGLDLTQSILSSANRKDLCFELSYTNNVVDNVLTSAIDSTKTLNVANVTEKGFTVSEEGVLVDKPLLGIRTVGFSFYFDSSLDTTTAETVFLNKFTANGSRSYIQNSKIYIRTDNAWGLNNMAENLVTGVNTIFITYAHYAGNLTAEDISIYVNGVKYTAGHLFPFNYSKFTDLMNYLNNTTIPIQSYLVFDKALTQEEITALDNDLKGAD